MAHGQWTHADKTLPTRPKPQSFHRPSHRIGPVENPDRFLVLRSSFENIAQRGDESINAATHILEIHQQHIEASHHRRRRPAYSAVEAENRNAMYRIEKIRRLDHVVLLVAAQPMLRPKRRTELNVRQRRQRVKRMNQLARHRRRMRQQRHALACERFAQRWFMQQSVNAKFHCKSTLSALNRKCEFQDERIGMMKVGFARRMPQRPIR